MHQSLKRAAVLVLLAMSVSLQGCGYNEIQAGDEQVGAAWSEVGNQYQRRDDLIPNLVNTVKGVAEFERETLEAVVAARSKATQIQITPELLQDPAVLENFFAAQGELSGALSRLFAVAEAYPTLTASEAFRDLQAQLEGTENRITVARGRYIDAVRAYNTTVRTFPTLIIAKIIGADPKPTFAPREGVDDTPPEVKF